MMRDVSHSPALLLQRLSSNPLRDHQEPLAKIPLPLLCQAGTATDTTLPLHFPPLYPYLQPEWNCFCSPRCSTPCCGSTSTSVCRSRLQSTWAVCQTAGAKLKEIAVTGAAGDGGGTAGRHWGYSLMSPFFAVWCSCIAASDMLLVRKSDWYVWMS